MPVSMIHSFRFAFYEGESQLLGQLARAFILTTRQRCRAHLYRGCFPLLFRPRDIDLPSICGQCRQHSRRGAITDLIGLTPLHVIGRAMRQENLRFHLAVRNVFPDTPKVVIGISDDGWIATFCPHAGSSVIADSAGRLHSLWFTGGRADADETGIYYTYSDDRGKSFAPRKLMAKTPSHTVLHAQIVVDGNNHLWGIWENIADGEMNPQIFLAHRAADATQWSQSYRVSDGSTTAMLPTLATDGQKVYVSWTEKQGETSTVKVRTAALASS